MTLRELLVIQENAPDPVAVTSLTRTTTTATATTATPHGYASGDYVTIAGATPSGYNGKVKITVTGASTFTYVVNGALSTPATGTITALYVSNAQGQPEIGWSTYRTIHAELRPIRAWERLQVQALQGQLDYRFRARSIDCGGVTNTMRALWTPQWPPTGQRQHTLEIHGVLPEDDGRQYTLLECGEVA
jgi:head-tail adaptor